MAAATAFLLSEKSQAGIIEFFKQSISLSSQQWNLRENLRQIDLSYQRELDLTVDQIKARAANRLGDVTRLQNLAVPIVMPAVVQAVTYQASVFLTGNPLFGVVSSPEFADAALQMESLIDNQAVKGGWVREFILFLYDGFKYNLSALEVDWDREVTAAIETDVTSKNGKAKEILWEGNCVKRWDLYNSFWDTRTIPADICKEGEFAGTNKLMSRIALKQFFAKLEQKIIGNVKTAFESGTGDPLGSGDLGPQYYYIPQINSDVIVDTARNFSSTNWLAWAGIQDKRSDNGIEYKNLFNVTKLYGRILPSDFGIKAPSADTPQVWKFYIVNGQVLIYAERQTNAHNWIPVLFGQPKEDGLGYQTKSLAADNKPMQDVSAALLSSVMAARRRAISDRGLYDPSRITEAVINSPNPSAKMPVRPAAYGKNLGEAYFPIPFEDRESASILQLLPVVKKYSEIVSNQNPAKQGQFVKGNKTMREYEDVMSHANGPDQMTSILLEHQIFTPLKYILKINNLQYQGGVKVYSRNTKQLVQIDPLQLRQSVLDFKLSDGLLPSEKLINGDILQGVFQVLSSGSPVGAAYNLGMLFSYLIKSQGADITPFEKPPEQVAYEQAMATWQQTMMQLVQAKVITDPKTLPPMPQPQQYGYTPANTGALPAGKNQVPAVQ